MEEAPSAFARHAFICHASADSQAASALVEKLETEGLTCWLAPRDVPSGQNYAAVLQQAIEACEVFLILFSTSANESPHVANEIEYCVGKDKPILLVRTDQTDPRANQRISLFLGGHHWFDASSGLDDDHITRIAADLKGLTTPELPDDNAKDPLKATEWAIGIDVGGTKLRACVVDLANPGAKIPAERHYVETFSTTASAPIVLDKTREMVRRIVDDAAGAQPTGIGIGVPGQVDLRVGTLKFGPNFYGARSVPFKTHISAAFPGVPVRVDNEVRCATRCELHLGAGRDFEHFACIFVGKGVGSGTVVNRRIYFGHNYCAGEVGHIKVSNTGQPCACGQTGCLETFVKAQAIIDRAEAKAIDWKSRELDSALNTPEKLTTENVAAAIEAGDAAAREVAAEVGEDLGRGIANYLNLFNPAAVVVGGGIMTGFYLHMADHIAQAVHGNALAEVANTPIVPSGYSEEGIAIGAALLFSPEDAWPF